MATKWTPQMNERLRELYPIMINSDIAKEFGLTKHQVEYHAHAIGLRKPPGFNKEHLQESLARRRPCRQNAGWFAKGHSIGKGHRFKKGHRLDPDTEKKRIEHVTASRRKQTYDELIRIKYGLRRKTKMPMPEKVYYINKDKYIKNDHE